MFLEQCSDLLRIFFRSIKPTKPSPKSEATKAALGVLSKNLAVSV